MQGMSGSTPSAIESANSQLLNYASPVRAAPNLWAAAVLAIVGLGLIGLGGCFLIGVLCFHLPQVFGANAPSVAWTPGEVFFVLILYVLAAACFAGAFWVLSRTVVALFAMLIPR
jgi:hypothetical protein